MGTAVLSPFAPTQLDMKVEQPSLGFLNRLESCDGMLRRMEARTALLSWASSVVGLPISHISQVRQRCNIACMLPSHHNMMCVDRCTDLIARQCLFTSAQATDRLANTLSAEPAFGHSLFAFEL